jgi:hypothetical protein
MVVPATRIGLLLFLLGACFFSLGAIAGPIVCGYADPVHAHPLPPDDYNCAEIHPDPAGDAPAGVVGTIMDSFTQFTQAKGWHFPSGARDLSSDLKVNEYYAWVVNSPDIVSPSLNVINVGKKNLDVGGAVFSMTYTPKEGDPPANKVHFLQIYSQSLDGGPLTYHVDNIDMNDVESPSPFYDQVPGTPVERTAATAWFADEPFECENNKVCTDEGKEHHFAEFQFGVYLAVDDNDGISAVHNVTVYAGKEWGYSYGTLDAPEGPAAVLTGAGLIGWLILGACYRLGYPSPAVLPTAAPSPRVTGT